MNSSNFLDVSLSEIQRFFNTESTDNVSDQFFVSNIQDLSKIDYFDRPCRFDFCMMVFCRKGCFEIEMNLRKYVISSSSILAYVPGNVLSICNPETFREAEFTIVALSKNAFSDAKTDFSRIFEEIMLVLSNPCISLQDEEVSICRDYLALYDRLKHTSLSNPYNTMMSLGVSVFHYLGGVWSKRISEAKSQSNGMVRSKYMFERFISLVAEYHCSEHYVSFYADKLHITPKYLSILVKKTSGKSAPEWIDGYVMLHAKNSLKYSNESIKEIAYSLGFSNISVFFRYFKARTGMTPMEYRNKE